MSQIWHIKADIFYSRGCRKLNGTKNNLKKAGMPKIQLNHDQNNKRNRYNFLTVKDTNEISGAQLKYRTNMYRILTECCSLWLDKV